jgi:uncharacterized protein (TIGR03435 family)
MFKIMKQRLKRGIAVFAIVAGMGLAQTPSFEVASVKPSHGADRRPMFQLQPGGRLNVANFTVKQLIRTAYRVKMFQVSGGPGWTDSDFFDIAAKPDGSANFDQVMLMLQSLLADRFHLAIRRETREMPVYAMVVAKGGPKFKEVSESDPPLIDTGGRGRPSVTKIRRGLLVAQETTLGSVAFQLSDFLARTVVDKTGLTGKYDLKLEWQPDENQAANFQSMGVPEGFGAPAPDPMGPSLFAALQEQLGLRLEPQKGPVEMLVIERVERPAGN